MGKLLADEISDLATKPAVEDYDVEDAFEHSDKDSSDDSASGDEQLEKAHYAPVEKSKLRKDGVELGEKYQGSKGSRESAFGEGGNDENGVGDVNGSESDAMSFKTDSEDGEDEELEEEDPQEEKLQEGEDSQGEAEDETHEDEQRQRFAALVQSERRKAANNLSESTKRDAAKGLAILEQSKLFDNIIEVRMKLQKAVTDVNKLPVTASSWEKSGSSDTEKLLKHTVKLLNQVMGEIVDFRKDFQSRDQISEDTSEEAPGKRKRNFEELAKETEELDNQLRPYRSTVLHKWSTKISAASGGSALNNSKFKAINQPANVQVENQLADLPRLVKRTRLSRKGVQPIRFEQDRNEGKLSDGLNSEQLPEAEGAEDADIPKNYDPRRKTSIDMQENAYIFDDEDFYKILLNDLVDKKINNARVQGSGAQIAITTRSNKLKKDVDTKASKGRKLNYAVQDSIAHYEAPRNSVNQWSDEQIDEFFAGLLGQKVNFDEDADAQEQPEEDNAIKNDDIQIFG
ncbi:rRNA-processing protein bfr2 [Zygosaccharomyces mellis]|uniref:Protein BFR2 n=1 Tax=Zygosaccharomyces mellis TaxID=42258 RepID=A0A4C2EB03_9SACH|nr:rRNA-processing protein bfr2 [Zygosaccharomyces mellis]